MCRTIWHSGERQAHLVLPTTTLLEADDLLGSYGHHWLGAARPVVSPPPEVRSDLEIVQGLAGRLGLAHALAGTAREWKDRFIRPEARALGVTVEALERGPLRNPRAPRVLFEDRIFATPTGKVNLVTAPAAATGEDADYPLTLMALSTQNAQSSQWTRPVEGPAIATVHPEAACGVRDGELARLESRLGAMTVRVCHDPRQRRDVVLLPKGGHLADGRCANALVQARATDEGGGAAYHDERVRLRAEPLPQPNVDPS